MAKEGGTDTERPQSRRKGKGAAPTTGSGSTKSRRKGNDDTPAKGIESTQSRRKQKDDAEDAVPARPLLDRRRIITWAIAVAFLLVVFFVTQRDGGAPQPNAFAAQPQASVTGWSYSVHTAAGDSNVLCTDDTASCDPDELWRHHTAGATCALDVRLWLAGTDMPIVLRDVQGIVNGTAWAGDYTLTDNNTTSSGTTSPINITTTHIERPLAWDNGWWWRVESEHLRVSLEVPCDTHSAKVDLRLSASHLDGDAWSQFQSTRITLHDEYLARLGQVPR